MKLPDIVNTLRDERKDLTDEQAHSLIQRGIYAVVDQVVLTDGMLRDWLSTTTETTLTSSACTVTINRNFWTIGSRAAIKDTAGYSKELRVIGKADVGEYGQLSHDYVVLDGDTLDFTDAYAGGYGTIAVVSVIRDTSLVWIRYLWVLQPDLVVYKPAIGQYPENYLVNGVLRIFQGQYYANDWYIKSNTDGTHLTFTSKNSIQEVVNVNFVDFSTQSVTTGVAPNEVTTVYHPAEAWYIPLPPDYHESLVQWCVAHLRKVDPKPIVGKTVTFTQLRSQI